MSNSWLIDHAGNNNNEHKTTTMSTKQQRADEIAEKCEQAGCPPKLAQFHYRQFVKRRWDPHPPKAFEDWWIPVDEDAASRAHIGGHPDARRRWARKDAAGWTRGWYGVTAVDAWNCDRYREEYNAWVDAGSPQRVDPFVSIALPLEEQARQLSQTKETVSKIGKPMPKAQPTDYDHTNKPHYAKRDEEPIDF